VLGKEVGVRYIR